MRLNWLAYNYRQWDGYGRYSTRLIQALKRAGVSVTPHFAGSADAPAWMRDEWELSLLSIPTISCLPPYYLRKLPNGHAPHWLLTMTEGSECPDGWAEIINNSGVERVIVPCQHNVEAFQRGGVEVPVSVIHGGTDPDEFPLRSKVLSRYSDSTPQPYTFLALADRGKRKGWMEAYDAFFLAFGTVDETGPDEVRLIIKCRPGGNDLIDFIVEKRADTDPRITFLREDVADIAQVYALADCAVMPSRSEGWGMPMREAAMMGVPVITQAYSGMDDGYTHEWATVVLNGRMEPIDGTKDGHIKGEWRVVDRDELADIMRQHVENPDVFKRAALVAARWLRKHQTWDHSASALLHLLHSERVLAMPHIGAGQAEMEYA